MAIIYTDGWNVWGEWFLAVNHHNHKNCVPSILTHNLWLIFIEMKQKNVFSFFLNFFRCIPMKISHKLCIRMDGTQFLWLWWFTAKNHSPQTYQPAVYTDLGGPYKKIKPMQKTPPSFILHQLHHFSWELKALYSKFSDIKERQIIAPALTTELKSFS